MGAAYSITAAEELSIAEEVTVSLRPTEQSRDWRRRWAELQRDLDRLTQNRTEQLSNDTIQAAWHELESFYVQAYHLKDALKDGEPSVAGAVERAISRDRTLALLADLANLEKHVTLNRPPRSGDVPTISVEGVQRGSGEGGWRLKATITHHGTTLDGLDVASAVVGSWPRQLKSWGLIS